MFYISYKNKKSTITIAQFATKDEAEKQLSVIQNTINKETLNLTPAAEMTYENHEYYVSPKCSKVWKEEHTPVVEKPENGEVANEEDEIEEAPITIEDEDKDSADIYVDIYVDHRGKLHGTENEEYIPTDNGEVANEEDEIETAATEEVANEN